MRKTALKALLVMILLAVFIPSLNASDAYRLNAGAPGTPGPREGTPLILETEHVRIDDKHVRAELWVRNPTDEDIEITMEFPVRFDASEQKSLADNVAAREADEMYSEMSPRQEAAAYKKIARDYYGDFEVSQNGKKVTPRIRVDLKNKAYPLAFVWKATYPAGKKVRDVVTYPMNLKMENQATNDQLTETFTYITHTGASWAKATGTARFEFCAESARDLIAHGNAWISYSKEDPVQCTKHRISIGSKPFLLDKKNGCIVWTRKNWRPESSDTDLKVESVKEYDRECSVFGTFLTNLYPLSEAINDAWCVDNSSEESAAEHEPVTSLAHSLGGSEHKLTKKELDRAFLKSVERFDKTFADDAAFAAYLSKYPRYFQIRDRLRLYRYLRNYYSTLQRDKPRNGEPGTCFETVAAEGKKEVSENAKYNIKLLLAEEKRLTAALKKERAELLTANPTF